MKFGIFFEMSTPRPFTADVESAGVPQRPRAGAPGRRARLRLGVGGRAPLPRGVLALLGARARARRGGARRPSASASGTARWCACRRSTTRSGWPSGPPPSTSSPAAGSEFGTARSLHVDRARRLQRRSRRHQEDVGRVRARPAPQMWARRAVRLRRLAASRCRSATCCPSRCRSPPADVGDGDQPGHRARRGRPGSRLPRRGGRRLRRAGAADPGVPPPHPALRPGGRRGQRPGHHPELPLLPRRPATGRRGPAWAWSACSG